jgi:hypothetical protein
MFQTRGFPHQTSVKEDFRNKRGIEDLRKFGPNNEEE